MNKLTVWRPALLCAAMISLLSGNPAGAQSEAAVAAKAADNKPDLVVAVKSTPLLRPLQDVTVTVTVKNKGAGPAAESGCDVFIRNGHAPRETVRVFKKVVRALDPEDQYSFSFSIKLNLGLFEIEAAVDRKKKIPEADETNNKTRIMIEGK
jgi:subtilase family serine protease